MKRISIIFALVIFSALAMNAQAPLEKGGAQLNAGFGLSGWGVPIYVGLDFGVGNDFTLGFEGSFASYSYGYNNRATLFSFFGNANYHFNRIMNIPSNWDFYGGLCLGFYGWSNGYNSSGLNLGLQVGGRYFFSKNFGLNFEFGGGSYISGGKFGITYRFK